MKNKLLALAFILALSAQQVFALNADVTGTVQLVAKKVSSFPDRLVDIFTGRDDSLPTKKGKAVEVEATYTGQNRLRVTETGDHADSEKKYFFDIPVPTVMQTFTNKLTKSTQKSGLVQAIFASTNELDGLDDDTESIGDNFDSSITKTIKVRKKGKKGGKGKTSSGSLGEMISVVKLVASRKGDKGVIKGKFSSEGNAAQGRFALKFTFND